MISDNVCCFGDELFWEHIFTATFSLVRSDFYRSGASRVSGASRKSAEQLPGGPITLQVCPLTL
jgi:hypothetical protein